MTILSGQTIREKGIMEPFSERQRYNGMSFGVGPAGYDVRLDQPIRLKPGDFTLASTMERFKMPNNVIGIVHDKSTLARLGIACQNTVIEPGWEGYLTLEITNHAKKRPWWKFWEPDGEVFLDDGTPIAQILFHYTDEPVEKSYDGKYHNQERGPQAARFE